MANLFAFRIPDSPAGLLATYGAGAVIRVQSCPTETGVYGDVTTIPLVADTETYVVYDENGAATDWYQVRYEAADGDPAGSYADPFQPMPQAGVYASLSQFELFIRDDDTADRDLKLLALDAASRCIDRATNQTFGVTAAVPPTITNACLLQASRFYKRRDSPYGVAGSPEMGSELRLLARLDPDVAVMVASYKRNWGAVDGT